MGRRKLSIDQMTPEQIRNRRNNERHKPHYVENALLKESNVYNIVSTNQSINDKNMVKEYKKQHVESNNHKKWFGVLTLFCTPHVALYSIVSTFITLYLVYQNYLYLCESNDFTTAVSSSIICEMILCLCGALLASEVKRLNRLLMYVLMLGTMFTSIMYMHAGISGQAKRRSADYLRLEDSYNSAKDIILSLKKSYADLPESHITRKETLMSKITDKTRELKDIDDELRTLGSTQNVDSTVIFGSWLRLCCMIMVAYIVHLICRTFRKDDD